MNLRNKLWLFCVCIVVCAVPALSFAAESADAALYAALKGRWEGTLAGAFRTQDVSWHFELDGNGVLKGYMGPSLVGMPSLPMDNLVVSDGELSFSIESQHGSFRGVIAPDGVAGTWQQGGALPLRMTKKDFVFPLADSAREALLGRWELQDRNADGIVIQIRIPGLGAERPPATTTYMEFTETAAGLLSGVITIPTSKQYDIPLVDIFVNDEGFAQFATDNGQSFTGRLINGVLVGDYDSGGRTSRRTFARTDTQDRVFDLQLSESARAQLGGLWYYEVWGDDVVLEVVTAEAGNTRAQLIFDEGKTRLDPLLELVVDGDTIRFATFHGRTFNGVLDAEGLVGEYRVTNYPNRATFTRTPPD